MKIATCAICYETLKLGERVICKDCRGLEEKVEAATTKRLTTKEARKVG